MGATGSFWTAIGPLAEAVYLDWLGEQAGISGCI